MSNEAVPRNARRGRWSGRGIGVVLLALLAAAGCARGPGDVSGQVTYKGQPLPSGRVTFLSQVGDQKSVSGEIKEGAYSISGCPAGPVKITVETFRRGAPAQMPKDVTGGMKQFGQYGEGGGKYEPIPERYSDFDKSGLTYTVKRGKQEHPITLTEP